MTRRLDLFTRVCVSTRDVFVEPVVFDAPLATAAHLDCGKFARLDQRADLADGNV